MSELLTLENIEKAIQSLDHMRNYSQLGKTYDELLALNIGIKALELLKHRSRPELRGELETVLKRLFFEYGVKVSVPLGLETPDREAYVRPIWVNQLLLFYPDEEAIRQDERERIKLAVIEAGTVVDHPTKSKRSLLILLGEFFKALKKGE